MSKTSIAIVGANGILGQPTIEAFKSPVFAEKTKKPIKVLSRKGGEATAEIEYVKVDWADVDSISESLKGTDVIISLVQQDAELFSKLEKIVKTVKPKLYIPSQFGTEIDKADSTIGQIFAVKTAHSKAIRDAGIKTVDIITGYFANTGVFLYEVVGHVGADPASKKVKYLGSPDAKISFTNALDIGRTVASVATSDPSSLPDKIRVQSGELSFKEIVSRYEDTHNVKFEESVVSADEGLKEAKELLSNDTKGQHFLFYLNAIAAQGVDKGLWFSKNENEIVNPSQKYWKWEKF